MHSRITKLCVGIFILFLTTPAWADSDEEVVDWVDSETNETYKAKTEAEGATWTFDPDTINLNQGVSSSGTSFKGARILEGNKDVFVDGDVLAGQYNDMEYDRYTYWEGNTLYMGVTDHSTENSVDAIIEFYWFESSIPRGSDFYVMLVKVKSSPNPWDDWYIVRESPGNWLSNLITFWQDVQPAQNLGVRMEPGGEHGSLRWDFCVPFETYEWEPYKTMQIQEEYGAGFIAEGGTGGSGGGEGGEEGAKEGGTEDSLATAVNVAASFAEGGAIADLTSQLLIQAKGSVNESFKISTEYTVTLHRWLMLVQSGGEEMQYKLAAIEADDDENAVEEESAYFEYFIVMQAERGQQVHIQDIEIGAQFKRVNPLWFDSFKGLSAVLSDIWITPPPGICLPGEIAPVGACPSEGVCGSVKPLCDADLNQWYCPVVASYEQIEFTCDGLDNDCDGKVDEGLTQTCNTACGSGLEVCEEGSFQGCSAPQPSEEICDGMDNDCDGVTDEGIQEACETSCGVGIRTCTNGAFSSCDAPAPTSEICDGLDNDCDGTIDEYVYETCTSVCGQGESTCVDGAFQGCTAPQPLEEICDGVDNDCDGQTDETLTIACESQCGSGTKTCSNGAYGACEAPTPSTEICDGLDNDCDGQTDEGVSRFCQTACGTGMEFCADGVFTGCDAPQVEAEVCDGIDNDCDGSVDEGLVRACSSTCGNGYESCIGGSYSACDAPQPQPEQCGDQLDNDCDGVVDNGCEFYTGGDSDSSDGTEEPGGSDAQGNPQGTEGDNSLPSSDGVQASQGSVEFPTVAGEASSTDGQVSESSSETSSSSSGCTVSQGDSMPSMLWILVMMAAWLTTRRTRRRHARI